MNAGKYRVESILCDSPTALVVTTAELYRGRLDMPCAKPASTDITRVVQRAAVVRICENDKKGEDRRFNQRRQALNINHGRAPGRGYHCRSRLLITRAGPPYAPGRERLHGFRGHDWIMQRLARSLDAGAVDAGGCNGECDWTVRGICQACHSGAPGQ